MIPLLCQLSYAALGEKVAKLSISLSECKNEMEAGEIDRLEKRLFGLFAKTKLDYILIAGGLRRGVE